MKKVFYLIAAMFLVTAAVSCEKDKKTEENSIIGEWSCFRDSEAKQDVVIHLSIKPDGKFEMVMPAWIERHIGTYSVQGNSISYKIDKLEWVIDRNNGYVNVYDQYGCWFKYDDWELPADQREIYEDPHAVWIDGYPERASVETEFSIDKDGILTFKKGLLGVELQYFRDPDFDAVEAVKPHLQLN